MNGIVAVVESLKDRTSSWDFLYQPRAVDTKKKRKSTGIAQPAYKQAGCPD
jgi:hypothetical protein